MLEILDHKIQHNFTKHCMSQIIGWLIRVVEHAPRSTTSCTEGARTCLSKKGGAFLKWRWYIFTKYLTKHNDISTFHWAYLVIKHYISQNTILDNTQWHFITQYKWQKQSSIIWQHNISQNMANTFYLIQFDLKQCTAFHKTGFTRAAFSFIQATLENSRTCCIGMNTGWHVFKQHIILTGAGASRTWSKHE